NPSRHSRQAVSARNISSWRVPNRKRRSAAFSGVLIKCVALIAAISAASGFRSLRSSTKIALARQDDASRRGTRELKNHCAWLRQQRLGDVIERIAKRPVAPDKAADLPGEQEGKSDEEQRPDVFADRKRANEEGKQHHANYRDQRERCHIGVASKPAGELGAASRLRQSRVEFGDEGAVARVLRGHQRCGLPRRREDRQASAVLV